LGVIALRRLLWLQFERESMNIKLVEIKKTDVSEEKCWMHALTDVSML